MTSSNGNIFCVTGPLCGTSPVPVNSPHKLRPVTRSFDIFFDLRLNKRLSKQLWGWWLETPSWSLWRQCNGDVGVLIWNMVTSWHGNAFHSIVHWWGKSMMTSSNGDIFRVTGPLCGEFTGPGEFPAQRPVTRSFDVFFDLCLNKRLSKQPRGWWFEALSWSLWRHRNARPAGWWQRDSVEAWT